jgi:hypothetical protein
VPWRYRGGVKIKLHHSWPRHWVEVSGQLHAPAALSTWQKPPVLIRQEAGWAPQPIWTLWRREKSCTAEKRTQVIQPVARRCTDWAICLSIFGATALFWPWPLCQFLNLYTIGRSPWTGDQPDARPLPTQRTTQTENKRTHRHPCFEWNSNPRSQLSSRRRRFMP